MITDSDVFLDTNILIYLSLDDFDAQKHLECRKVMTELKKNRKRLFVSTQILREFYAVATREKYFNNPLQPNVARAQISSFQAAYNIIDVTQDVIYKLTDLLEKYEIKGRKVHDAAIAASMWENNIRTLITYNKKDFVDFDEIKTFTPLEL